jgi:hypothetical protein
MTSDGILAAWEYPRTFDGAARVEIAQDELERPDLRLQVLSSAGDTITVQVVDGVAPLEPEAVLYVQRRGSFEITRRETWLGGRVLLSLAAWPRR